MDEVASKISNIVTDITNEFVEEEFKAKMNELKVSKRASYHKLKLKI